MAGLGLSGSSREGLFLALFLVGAIAAVNGTTFINNNSTTFVALFDTTAPAIATQIAPGLQFTRDFGYSNDVTETHLIFFEYYDAAPNTTANAPPVSGDKFVFASAQVFDNATITFFTPVGWIKVGVKVEYAN